MRGVTFDVAQGEIVGVVGESGCGKSVTASSILRVLPENAWHSEGRILFMGRDLLTLSQSQMRAVRGRQISMIFQDPMTSLSPLMRIGDHAVIGAGSVVTKDVPGGVLAVGSPARVLRAIGPDDEVYYRRGKRIADNLVDLHACLSED